ncbi:hypothetical protein Micbo1qcDRAFT_177920 [Microdochium bolleyi]|uniref:BTB domain-containing protein n=1 Tax=Microdochium bolleyi TaxID=196109 RepID=A0A136IVU0_9PEZI|nr:hypothetical protein Micbo1qcDRAFT_177920 [Microdochium bolleyi]
MTQPLHLEGASSPTSSTNQYYTQTATLHLTSGQTLQIHDFILAKLGLSDSTTGTAAQDASRSYTLDLAPDAAHVLVHYLYTGNIDSPEPSGAASGTGPSDQGANEARAAAAAAARHGTLLELTAFSAAHHSHHRQARQVLRDLSARAQAAAAATAAGLAPAVVLDLVQRALPNTNLVEMTWLQNYIDAAAPRELVAACNESTAAPGRGEGRAWMSSQPTTVRDLVLSALLKAEGRHRLKADAVKTRLRHIVDKIKSAR